MQIVVVPFLEPDLLRREAFIIAHCINAVSDFSILVREWLHLGEKWMNDFGVEPDYTHLDQSSCKEEYKPKVILGPLHNLDYEEEYWNRQGEELDDHQEPRNDKGANVCIRHAVYFFYEECFISSKWSEESKFYDAICYTATEANHQL